MTDAADRFVNWAEDRLPRVLYLLVLGSVIAVWLVWLAACWLIMPPNRFKELIGRGRK